MKYEYFDIALNTRNDIVTVTMNHPPSNGMSLEFTDEFVDLLNGLEKRKVKGLILASYSDTIFSAGLDLNEVNNLDKVRLRSIFKNVEDAYMLLYNSSFPTAALITGHCVGGGCLLTLACEYRVMVNGYTIGLPEIALGIIPPPYLNVALNNAVGWRNADYVLNTGKNFSAEEALKIGLIDEISPDRANALKKVDAFFKLCHNVCPLARTITKQNRRAKDMEYMKETEEQDVDFLVTNIMQPEFQERIQNYFKKLKSKSSKL